MLIHLLHCIRRDIANTDLQDYTIAHRDRRLESLYKFQVFDLLSLKTVVSRPAVSSVSMYQEQKYETDCCNECLNFTRNLGREVELEEILDLY